MTPHDRDATAPPLSGQQLEADAALAEIREAKTAVRARLRWHAVELLGGGLFLSVTPLVLHVYPGQVGLWLWTAVPLMLAIAAVISWRRRVVGRDERVSSARVVTLAIALSLAVNFVLDLWAPLGLNPVSAGIAAIPVIPSFVAAVRILLK